MILLILILIPILATVDAWLIMLASNIIMGAFDKPGFGFWASLWLGVLFLGIFPGGLIRYSRK